MILEQTFLLLLQGNNYLARMEYDLVFTKKDDFYDASVQLHYGLIVSNKQENFTRVEAILTNLHESTESLEMHWNGYVEEEVDPPEGETVEYLDIVMNKSHPKLKRICISKGYMYAYPRANVLQSRAPSVKQLIFKGIELDTGVFDNLSADFPALDYLEFDRCQFGAVSHFCDIKSTCLLQSSTY